jgi:hypothetical protein
MAKTINLKVKMFPRVVAAHNPWECAYLTRR